MSNQNEVAELLGKDAYETFYGTMGQLLAISDPTPPWDTTPYAVRDAWKSVAMRLIEIHENARIQSIAEAGFGGMLETGEVVDRRVHPAAKPLKASVNLGIPEPSELIYIGSCTELNSANPN